MKSTPSAKVLILCTGNSARSVLGEYLLRVRGGGRFETYSAGSRPTGRVNPLAVRVLQECYDIDASYARSKSWDEFRKVSFDYVITVCDHAKESCPAWLGSPIVAHWGSPDPAGVDGTDEQKYQAFVAVAAQIAQRVDAFCALTLEAARDPASVRGIADDTPLPV
jgi:arsenate reductase (thioredoxin)